MPKGKEQLSALASYLATRHAAIMRAWSKAVKNDPVLVTASSLSRAQLYDHIPHVLNNFQSRLLAYSGVEKAAAADAIEENAAGHGIHRWQQGYQLREVVREWGHLHLCLIDELESYTVIHSNIDPGAMAFARRALAELCHEGTSESTAQYFQLRQAEAAGHVRDLRQTLEQVSELQRQRAELWRQAAHDLRGNLGVVSNVAFGLAQDESRDTRRDQFVALLQEGIASLQSMLDDVMDLARLEAGQELPEVAPLDAAVLLRQLADNLRNVATERGLFLKTDGPAALAVQGDAGKITRIAQNLLLNALKYTVTGGVTLSWGDSRTNDAERWMLCVEDTGPGFHAGPGAPLAAALKQATAESRQIEDKTGDVVDTTGSFEPAARVASAPDPRPVHQGQGEGIGLSIVKRLCEILDAGLELDSKPGVGATFRVILPRHYDAAKSR